MAYTSWKRISPGKVKMKSKPKEPMVPPEKYDTIRKEIISLLKEATEPVSAKDISMRIRVSEKEIPGHLEHIRIAAQKGDHRLLVIPARCKQCGFEFKKRDRLTKPSKCPICRSQQIEEPRFQWI